MELKKIQPVECAGAEKSKVTCNTDAKNIRTRHVIRQNLTMGIHIRRFTLLTNAFSKKIENHYYAIALQSVYYLFVKIHAILRVTPAQE